VEGDGHAVSSKGRDDGGLIADAPQGGFAGGEIAVGDGGDGERTRPEGFGALDESAQMRIGGEDRGQEMGPIAVTAQYGAANDEAEVGEAAFDERETTVSAGEKEELHAFAKHVDLGGRETPVELESDEVRLFGGRADEAANIVLSGGKKNNLRAHGLTVAERGDPAAAFSEDSLNSDAANDFASRIGGAGKQGLVEDATRKGKRLKREGRFSGSVAR